MSTFRPADVPCPGCGFALPTMVLRSVRIRLLPAVREDVLAGRHGRLTCPVCRTTIQVEVPCVYLDTVRGQYFGVALPSEEADAAAVRARHVASYDEAITAGPPPAQQIGAGMHHRLVFGAAALREKLLLADAGIDDRCVEAAKLAMMAELGVQPGSQRWRVEAVFDGGHLMCRLADGDIELLPAGYRPAPEAVADVAPWLTDEWLVDASVGLALVG